MNHEIREKHESSETHFVWFGFFVVKNLTSSASTVTIESPQFDQPN